MPKHTKTKSLRLSSEAFNLVYCRNLSAIVINLKVGYDIIDTGFKDLAQRRSVHPYYAMILVVRTNRYFQKLILIITDIFKPYRKYRVDILLLGAEL